MVKKPEPVKKPVKRAAAAVQEPSPPSKKGKVLAVPTPAAGKAAAKKKAELEAAEAKKAAEVEARKKAAEVAAVAAKKRAEELAATAARKEAARKAAEAAAAAQKQADILVARPKAREQVEAAHKQAEVVAAAAKQRAIEAQELQAVVEAAAAAQKQADDVAAAARKVASEAAAAAKLLDEEAVAAQKRAEQAASAAAVAKAKASAEDEVAQKQAAAAAAARSNVVEQAGKVALQKQAGQDVERKLAVEDCVVRNSLQGFCNTFDLKVVGGKDDIIKALEAYLNDADAAEAEKKRLEEERLRTLAEAEKAQVFGLSPLVPPTVPPTVPPSAHTEDVARHVVQKQAEGDDATRGRAAPPAGPLAVFGFAPAVPRIRPPPAALPSTAPTPTAPPPTVPPPTAPLPVAQLLATPPPTALPSPVPPAASPAALTVMPQMTPSVPPKAAPVAAFGFTAAPAAASTAAPAAATTAAAPAFIAGKETQLYKISAALGTAIRSGSAQELASGAGKYEGRLSPGALLERVDTNTYKNEFGIDQGLFLVAQDDKRQSLPSTSIYVGLRDVSFLSTIPSAHSKPPPTMTPTAPPPALSPIVPCVHKAAPPMPPTLPSSLSSSAPVPAVSFQASSSSLSAPVLPILAPELASVPVDQPFEVSSYPQHSNLIQGLATSQEVLEKKKLEAEAAKSAHSSAIVRNGVAEDAAKPEAQRVQDALATAQRAESACASETSRVKGMHAIFAEVDKSPSDQGKVVAKTLAPQLKLFNVAKKTIDELPKVLAKKKRTAADKKLLSSIDDAFTVYSNSRALVLAGCKAEVKKCMDGVAAKSLAKQARAKELLGFKEAFVARETEREACDQAVSRASSELTNLEERMTKEGLMRFSSSSRTCGVCCDDVAVGAAVLLGCTHGWYCSECLTRFVESRLEGGQAGDVPCPDCKETIPQKDLVKLLPRKTIFRLHARSIEKEAVEGGAIPRSCPTLNCPMRQTLKEGHNGCLTCPMCAIESCWLCSTQPFHDGRTCEQHARRQRAKGQNKDEDALFKWMEETGTVQCPKCQMATTKENLDKQTEQRSECHKMLCRNCSTKFCFKCLAILTDGFSCGCTKNKHGFIDPHTGELVKHKQRKTTAKPK